MRTRTASGIMHYKLMLFAGQSIVEFSGANFSADAWVYTGSTPYVNYVDESVYFTNRSSFVHSFMTKFDDLWTTSTGYANYANVPATPHPELSDLYQGAAAQLPARRVVREARARAYSAETRADRRHHVPHHRPPAHRRDDRGQAARSVRCA